MLTMNEVENTPLDRLAALQELDRKLKDRRDRMTALVSKADDYEQELGRQRALVNSITIERDTLETRRVAMDRAMDALRAKFGAGAVRRGRGFS